jgi:hypothetical protein
MSKYPKLVSWWDRDFTRKTAMEMHRAHWRWQRGGTSKRYGYAFGLKRGGRLEELTRFLEQEKRVQAHWDESRGRSRPIDNGTSA